MFNLLKIIMTIGFIKRNKRSVLLIFFSILAIVITQFMTADLLKVVSRGDQLKVFVFKWIAISTFVILILWIARGIFTSAKKSAKETVSIEQSEHKRTILAKKEIKTQGEAILQRYSKGKSNVKN